MADVKFMDLSQNDNPATTDSVLIGNSTDGLKRTTVGAIGNLFAVKGLFHFETITGQTNPTATEPGANMKVAIVPPVVPGYSFVLWLNSSTVGDIQTSFVDFPLSQQAFVWVNTPAGTTNPIKITVLAAYVKSTVY